VGAVLLLDMVRDCDCRVRREVRMGISGLVRGLGDRRVCLREGGT
jgi:hypothetical protein